MLDVCLLGTGGMMPLPKRYLTSLMLRYNGSGLLVDCGEGTQMAIREYAWSFHQIDTICFTHYHGDHVSGLPGILLAMANAERTEPLTLIGPKGLARVVGGLRVIAPELPFEIKMIELTEPKQQLSHCGYQITAFRVRHNMVCYGYRFDILRAGRFDAARAKEQGIPLKFWNPLQKGATVEHEGRILTPDMVLGPARKGIALTYVTDSRPTQMICEMAAGCDLFICEGMYGEADKQQKAVEHRHMTMQEAAELAKKAKPSPAELWLTHYSPSMVRPDPFMDEVQRIFANAKPGRDGKSTELNFQEE